MKKLSKKELNAENARRRKANPGNGTAFESALVFMGNTVLSASDVVAATRKVDAMKSFVDAAQDKLESIEKPIAGLIKLAWETKQSIRELESRLKTPAKSSVYRALKAEHTELTAAVAKAHVARKELAEKLADTKAELRATKAWLKRVQMVGDGLSRAYILRWQSNTKKAEKQPKELDANTRHAAKVAEKEHIDSFPVLTFNPEVVNKSYKDDVAGYQSWKPYNGDSDKKKAENDAELMKAREALGKFVEHLKSDSGKGFTVKKTDGRATRLPKTTLARMFNVDMDSAAIHSEFVVINHGFEDFIDAHWKVFGENKEAAEKTKKAIAQQLYRRLNVHGVTVVGNEAVQYRFVFSSSSHQKDEKAVFAPAALLKLHEEYLYFSKFEEFVQKPMLASAYLKAMANRTRPIATMMELADGTPVTVFDILCVKDVKRVYHHDNALTIGGSNNGQCWKRGPVDNPVICGDGQMIALRELKLYGQVNGEGWKGLVHGNNSVVKAFCHRYNLTVEEFYDLVVETFDGKKTRLGDFMLICGEGCFKFDKFFENFDGYKAWIRQMMPKYPGIEKLSILRQLDDEEGERKTRRLTRSLIQQWVWADNREIRRLVDKEVRRLTNFKTMQGALMVLAEMDKPESERSAVARVFEKYPQLILNPNMQRYIRAKYDAWKKDAMANKIRTKGQYPYIIQDPLALLEIWVLGKDPNEEGLGLLREGEISLNEVPENKEVLAVRFPANFLTAKVLRCVPHADVYASCGNCAVLSIYDDVLIRQDGDVDGDEMCIIYDELAISLTKRMIAEFDPPVIVFAHGGKAKATAPGSEKEFWKQIGDALYSAHHNGQVGKYANLARDCVYLLSIAYRAGDDKAVENLLLWMAAASTGAILAIDQVKGNAVDESLISWLDEISKAVKKAMEYKQPYTQQFLKKDVYCVDCLPANPSVLTDAIAMAVDNATGEFKFDAQNIEYDAKAMFDALRIDGVDHFKVRNNVLNDEIVRSMRANFFNDAVDNKGAAVDAEFLAKVKKGEEVSLKESLLFWWHNERALKNRLEGKLLSSVQADLYDHIRSCLKTFVFTNKKANGDGHVRTKREELASLYTSLLNECFELTASNGIQEEDKSSYSHFILQVIAPWILQVVEKKEGTAATMPSPSICTVNVELPLDISAEEACFNTEDYLPDESEFVDVYGDWDC